MSAQYDLVKTPTSPIQKETSILHPRLVSGGTIDTRSLIKEISTACTLTESDLAGALIALSDRISHHLSNGYHVELGDIGYLSAKLKAKKAIHENANIRSPSIVFDNVNFRASAAFRKKLQGDLVRAPYGFKHSGTNSEEERKALLIDYLNKNLIISRSDYTTLTGLLKKRALSELKQWANDGFLTIHGQRNQLAFSLANKDI